MKLKSRDATINAVLCKDYETDNIILQQGNWRKFRKEYKDKEVYLFGGGKGCSEFIEVYGKRIAIKGIIDSSPDKINKKINGIKVFDKSIIEDFSEEQQIIIITSAAYMNDIAEELNSLNFKNYYAYAVMESQKIFWRLFYLVSSFFIWRLHRIKKDKILVWNQMPPGNFSCNTKYIVQQLIDKKVPCEIVWLTNCDKAGFPKEVRTVNITPYNLMIEHATSKIWIDNYKKEKWMKKKKGQFYINTWHGSVPLKKIDFDTEVSSKSHLIRTVIDSEMIDLRLSNSEFCTNVYRNAMKYKNKVLEYGSPRLDKMTTGYPQIYEKLGIPEDSSIVLYAPTWRAATAKGEIKNDTQTEINYGELRRILKEKFGGDWYILIRPHPTVRMFDITKFQDSHIIDASASKYEDVYEILAEAKFLVSDYSSLIFEAGFFGKPVFIMAGDYETYKSLQGTYFELDELPYPLAYSFPELLANIKSFDREKYLQKLEEFHAQIKLNETGEASKKVVEIIKEIMIGGKKNV